ncbi:4-hydroxybenzoate polyprenyltransferase [Psychromonas sp. CNPT3]|uniref:4-hydroxybenzoate octaprenyltransferase n=1 Tax=Psychromonas sp. CNPT3 TaxID=314282 RepID=UPI00006E9565|nr:4-hydroxybenzoate octaprenyltransferase [Psychromonas sp. CNPT3]AGH80232.1 4-hydroxybenzoate polyprenyltransferase [Psychromonas sp. CNPT3]
MISVACRQKGQAYLELMRLNKPIGSLLLLWPTLWALWIAAEGIPDLSVLLVFSCGVFLMRSTGCVINDFADRKIDGFVERTKNRPLPSGRVSPKEALFLFFMLTLSAFLLVLTQNTLTIQLSVVGLLLASLYPFSKRVTHLPQFVLGLAFSWSIPMAYAAQSGRLDSIVWLLFVINVIWTIAYDTLYAMVDKEDDLKIGVKSSAILFSPFERTIIGVLQLISCALLVCLGFIENLNAIYFCSLVIVLGLFIKQHWDIRGNDKKAYFKAFLDNNRIGAVVFIAIFLNYL